MENKADIFSLTKTCTVGRHFLFICAKKIKIHVYLHQLKGSEGVGFFVCDCACDLYFASFT